MAYCRFGEETDEFEASDLYIYRDAFAFRVTFKHSKPEMSFDTANEVYIAVLNLIELGYRVPRYAVERLRDESENGS